jgi:hypothetical protein
MGKHKGGRYYPDAEEMKAVFGPGCRIDWENNTIYGANGKVYRDVEINKEDLDRMIQEILAERRKQ